MKALLTALLAFSVTILSLDAASCPTFTLKKLDGSTFNMADHLGKKTVVLNFWTSCCPTGYKNLKQMQKIQKEFPDVLVLAISIDSMKSQSQVGSYVKMRKYTFEVALDPDINVCKQFNPGGTAPHTVIIDKKGEITYSQSDYISGYEDGLMKALAAARK